MRALKKFALGSDGLPTRGAVAAYQRDGVVCLENAFSDDWVQQGRRAVAAAIRTASNSLAREDHKNDGESGTFFFDTFLWKRLPSFERFTFRSPAARLAQRVMRSRSLLLYFDMAIVKEPGTSAQTPWHYDEAYWPVSGTQVCNVWTALDDVPEETALRFVLGSHQLDQNYKAIDFFTEKGMRGQKEPDPPQWSNDSQGYEIACAPMKTGDCAILNFRTHHSAPGNLQRRNRRRVICTHWFGDDARFDDKPWECNPDERGDDLVHEGTLECETFPRLI
ncbi:MAG: phytanoyl-CoA dioxygenase family protein [Arenicellales bacterium]|jgi:ectoine hydroxylase-related dioxygenase (phytanoyl-CoA dioxygenase family)|nr:phytanoyl-CoA dioxygenase family protein [Arenicellales bacterium]